MTVLDSHFYDAEVYLNKKLIKKVYIVGSIIFLISVGCIIWSTIYWDEYTELRTSWRTGRTHETGLASILYGWGWAFAVIMPIIYGLMWFSLDFKDPILGVNSEGLYLNRELFKRTLLTWDEFEKIEKQENGDVWLYMKDPEKIIKQQPTLFKPFLKQTYLKDKSPIVIAIKDSDEEYQKIAEKIEEYAISV